MTNARSPHPSGLSQLWILVKKQLLMEVKQPRNLILRTILGPIAMLIYSAAFIAEYDHGATELGLEFETYQHFNLTTGTGGITPSPRIWLGGGAGVDLVALKVALDDGIASNETATEIFPIPPGNETIFENIYTGQHFEILQQQSGDVVPLVGVYIDREGASWSYSLYASGKFISSFSSTVNSNPYVSTSYARAGLLATQRRVNKAIYNVSGAEPLDEPSIALIDVQHMQPMPRDVRLNSADWLELWLPGFYIVVGLQFAMTFQLSPMIYEKRKGIIRAYILLGIEEVIYWFQWVCVLCISGIVASSITTVILTELKWIPLSNAFLIWICTTLAYMQLAAFVVMIPLVAPKEELAAIVPFLLMLVSGAVYVPVLLFEFPFAVQVILSLLNPYWAVFHVMAVFRTFDWVGFNTGITFSNAWDSQLGPLILVQLLAVVLYFSAVYYLFKPPRSKILSDAQRDELVAVKVGSMRDLLEKKRIEAEPEDQDVIVSITGLVKAFPVRESSGKNETFKAVDGLNLNVARGSVFGLLGPNGSGKSTTISMLAGEFLPTSGIAEYMFKSDGAVRVGSGRDSLIRSKIGVCPQENLLFDHLSAREHLRLFAGIKGGVPLHEGNSLAQDIELEVERLIEELQFSFEEDADKPVSTFSGGMKRKLSIAIALLGDPEVLFLDEPTAGVDVMGRAKIWEMIERAKKDRGVVLTTHFMDEADLLCDRIGIIKHGKMITSGSSLFLKSRFGVGYTLSYLTPTNAADETEIANRISNLVPKSVRGEDEEVDGINGEAKIRVKASWRIPQGNEAKFPDILTTLHDSNCDHVSLHLTTLEQVFLRIAAEDANMDDFDLNRSFKVNVEKQAMEDAELASEVDKIKAVWTRPKDASSFKNGTGVGTRASFWEKVKQVALIVGRNSRRDTETYIFGIGMPLAYLIIGFAIASTMTEEEILVTKDPYYVDANLFHGSEPTSVQDAFFGLPGNPSLTAASNITFTEFVPQSPIEFFNDTSRRYVGGFLANSTLMFNSTLVHSLPVLENLATNYSLQTTTGLLDGISAKIVPMPFINFGRFPVMALVLAVCLGQGFMALAFILIDIALLRDYELFTVFNVLGVARNVVYQGIAVMNTTLNFLPFFVVALVLALATANPVVGSGGRWLAFIALMISYGWAVTPFSMMFEPVFPSFSAAKDGFPFLWVVLTVVPFVVLSSLVGQAEDPSTLVTVMDALSFIPPFTFQRAFFTYLAFSSKYDDPIMTWELVWGWDARVTFCVGILFATGCLGWAVVVVQTYFRESRFRRGNRVADDPSEPQELADEGAQQEALRAFEGESGIRARGLVKEFITPPSSLSYKLRLIDPGYWVQLLLSGCGNVFEKQFTKKEAVKGLSFAVEPSQIGVLLGKNGAGKSTTISMIVRDLVPTKGNVMLAGLSNTAQDAFAEIYASGKVGYCAQKDTIFEKCTVEEHIQMTCGLRGLDVKDTVIQNHVDSVLRLLGLDAHLSKRAQNLSGGYKRKLCFAMAILGFPEVVVLDEPTTGIDPAARAEMHKLLKPRSHEGAIDNVKHASELANLQLPAMLLSTHNMEEAQALATRIGIMDNGAMVASGTVEELQERFSVNNIVEITFGKSDGTDAAENVLKRFRHHGLEPELLEALSWRIKLQFPIAKDVPNTLQLAELFRIVEGMKEEFGVEFYSVDRMGLEQIFVNLSSKEEEDEKEAAENK